MPQAIESAQGAALNSASGQRARAGASGSRRASFTFGIPLLPRACADSWPRVVRLLELTLRSVLAQDDPDFRVLIACHQAPTLPLQDPRIEWLHADWPVETVRPDNLDRGRKTALINGHVRDAGGGLLMFVDADDWVENQVVRSARGAIHDGVAAGVIDRGHAIDYGSMRAAPIPDPRAFDGAFHRICGSSVVLHVQPASPHAVLRDPNAFLHEHYRVPECAAEQGVAVVSLPASAAYLVNTAENHSERHGPFAAWRRDFVGQVNRHGSPLSRELARRYGVERALWP